MTTRLRTSCIAFFLVALGLIPLMAETSGTVPKGTVQKDVTPKSSSSTAIATQDAAGDGSLPSSYREISLGMAMDAVKEQLLADGLFGYRGERDVSLLPTMNRSLIETVGPSFIKRSWFQFHEDKLYVMTFTLDSERVDYYSMYSTLVSKYGEPVSLDPRKAVWDDGKIILSLERPLTVRYVDEKVFTDLLAASGTDKAASDLLRENFISDF
jgi:hypothetical protein